MVVGVSSWMHLALSAQLYVVIQSTLPKDSWIVFLLISAAVSRINLLVFCLDLEVIVRLFFPARGELRRQGSYTMLRQQRDWGC